jgi:hypothetical protein
MATKRRNYYKLVHIFWNERDELDEEVIKEARNNVMLLKMKEKFNREHAKFNGTPQEEYYQVEYM